jgi:SOS-response transcriptional repressor LexA
MNPEYRTLFVDPDDLEIFGVVMYVIHGTRG